MLFPKEFDYFDGRKPLPANCRRVALSLPGPRKTGEIDDLAKGARVACDCNGLKLIGTYEIDGDWLVLQSSLGEHRVRRGLANPRKLAARLIRNICAKAQATEVDPRRGDAGGPQAQSVSDKAHQLIDVQRDKILALASNDPARAEEEQALDRMLVTARAIDSSSVLLDPAGDPSGATDAKQ